MTSSLSSTSLSFAGISSGVDTDALVSAIMAQDSQPLVNLQNQQTRNNQATTALNTLQTDMTNLSSSLLTLQSSSSGFAARTVNSSDTTNTYVSATASGTTTGDYDVQVSTVATAGRILPTLVTNPPQGAATTTLSVADPSGSPGSQIFTSGSSASFAVQGTNGVTKVVTLNSGNNSLNGLASAINASGAGVTATIVNTGAGTTPYQLVVTANATGQGTTKGVVTLADVTNNNGTTANNTIGIAAGVVDSLTAPTSVTSGGLQSAAATNAVFTVNGIQLTRQSNTVTDAVPGLTLNLQQGGETAPTTLTVAEDTSTITASMQDVISKYNTLINDYTTSTKATKDTNGNVVPAPLSNNAAAENMMAQVQSVMAGIPAGMPASAPYRSVGDLGITANSDGTLSLDTNTFDTALTSDPQAAGNVFDFTGTTTNGVVNFLQGSVATTAQNVAFNITSYNGNTGAWSGTLAADGGAAIAVNGTQGGGVTAANAGTSLGSLSGIELTVTGTGSGTLSLTTGVAQQAQNLISNLTSATGTIWNTLQALSSANTSLATQITTEQGTLNNIQSELQLQFANMEATVAQLKTASGALGSSS